ncbi:MAG: M20/M25/M40 family metallo-hydrolase, partial [Anaerolineae bacterium]
MSQVLSYLETQQEAMTQALEQLVMIESPTNERDSVNAVGEWLTEAFRPLGATVERLPQAAFGDHLRVTWGDGEGQILLIGHMDTVWPLGETARRPFRVQGNRATGPGIFDMKGGLVVALYAVTALHELGLSPAH